MRQGRIEQAKAALRRVYGFKEIAFYDIEVARMQDEIRLTADIQGDIDAHKHKFLGVNIAAEAECFNATNRKRTFTAIFAASAQQMVRLLLPCFPSSHVLPVEKS